MAFGFYSIDPTIVSRLGQQIKPELLANDARQKPAHRVQSPSSLHRSWCQTVRATIRALWLAWYCRAKMLTALWGVDAMASHVWTLWPGGLPAL